jgi:benzoyl-CoA 2,3-dioxygenase component B
MNEDPNQDVRPAGGIPLDIIQKYINEWYSASLDLFGGEDSSNAASYFARGLKGRYKEGGNRYDDHVALEGIYTLEKPRADGSITTEDVPLRRAMNLVLRDAYVEDCVRALGMWNKSLKSHNIDRELSLPSDRFNRLQGLYENMSYGPQGDLWSREDWDARRDEFLPSQADYDYVESLMQAVYEPGKFANWIAPPKRGINGRELDFMYAKFDEHVRS